MIWKLLPVRKFRHRDSRFKCVRFDYQLRFAPIGLENEQVGAFKADGSETDKVKVGEKNEQDHHS